MAKPASKTKPRKKAVAPPKKPVRPGHDHNGCFTKGNALWRNRIGNGWDAYPGDDEALEATVSVMSKGGTKAMLAVKLGVTYRTIRRWQIGNETFQRIMDIGETLAQAWHEEKGLCGMDDSRFNAGVWKFFMVTRFRDDYTERSEIAVSGLESLVADIHARNEKLMGAGQ